MHYTVGPNDSVSSPSFTLTAAPLPPSIPIGSVSHPLGSSKSAVASPNSVRQVQPSTPAPRSTFPNPPSHPNPAFASVLKREAAASSSTQAAQSGQADLADRSDGGGQDCTARAASVAGPSTQPETAFAVTATAGPGPATSSSVSSVPIRLATASDADTVDDQDTDERGQGEDYPYTVSTRIRETMAEHSAVISTFIAGGLAGAASRTVVSPLERLKIIL